MTGSKSLTRQHYSPEFKLRLVRMAIKTLEENGSVAALARQHNVNDNLLFKVSAPPRTSGYFCPTCGP